MEDMTYEEESVRHRGTAKSTKWPPRGHWGRSHGHVCLWHSQDEFNVYNLERLKPSKKREKLRAKELGDASNEHTLTNTQEELPLRSDLCESTLNVIKYSFML